MKGHVGMETPKKATKQGTTPQCFYGLPFLDIFLINPQHIAIHSYSQPFEHYVLTHTSISLQQPALYTQHCSYHITIHTSSNKRLQLCTMLRTSHAHYRILKLVNSKTTTFKGNTLPPTMTSTILHICVYDFPFVLS